MAMNLTECDDITAAAEGSGAGCAARLHAPIRPGLHRRRRDDHGGEIGTPMIIKSLTHGPGLPPAWANDIRTSNGMLAEVNSHDLDTVTLVRRRRASRHHGPRRQLQRRRTQCHDSTLLRHARRHHHLPVRDHRRRHGELPSRLRLRLPIRDHRDRGPAPGWPTGPGGSRQSRRVPVTPGRWSSDRRMVRPGVCARMVEIIHAIDGEPVRVGSPRTQAITLGPRGRCLAAGGLGAYTSARR